jgi:uncharacterized protein YnzC (UPF0291/DUF896 family)
MKTTLTVALEVNPGKYIMNLEVVQMKWKVLAVSVMLALVAGLGVGSACELNHNHDCFNPMGVIGATPFTKSDVLIPLIVYSDKIGLTESQLEEIYHLRLDYLRQYRDLYAQFIHTALEYENTLRADDYEGVKGTVDKDLAIYRDIGHMFVEVHQVAYTILSEPQFTAFQRYRDEPGNPEGGTLLSGTPFSPPNMFTWHLTLAREIGLTESQVKMIEELRKQYHEKFLDNRSQLTRLESEFEQIMAVKEIDMNLASAKIDQILDLYRDLGYTYADLGEQLCENILTKEEQARFREAYLPMWEPIINAWKEILEEGYMP